MPCYDPRSDNPVPYEVSGLRAENDMLRQALNERTSLLCVACTVIEYELGEHWMSEKLHNWWVAHQEFDKNRSKDL